MKLCKLLFSLVFVLFCGSLESQTPYMPQVIPPSPEASSLMRYLDYPVSNATGIPDISIPLYVIKSGQLSVPISLSYHSSGRRVYDKTGAVGLGWNLNAGGMISRTIYGDADGWNYAGATFPYPWKKAADLFIGRDFPFIAAIDNRTAYSGNAYDTEYDIFSYSANGLSGSFILKDNSNNKIPVLIPKKPYTLQYISNNNNDYYELADENGVTYRFGKTLTDGTSVKEYSGQGATGWMLTDIISTNKEDTIHFKYQGFNNVSTSYSTIYNKTTLYFDWSVGGGIQPVTDPIIPREVTSTQAYTSQRLKEISFRQGKVVFNTTTDNGYPPDCNLRVTSIEVRNTAGTIIKRIDMSQSLMNSFTDGTIMGIYKLNSIIFKDKALTPIETYSFDYYPVTYPGGTSAMNVRFQDFWGYYNASGKTDMCPYIPTTSGTIIPNTNANRDPNFEAAKSGVLKRITYPTGGYTEFTYQLNQYNNQGTAYPGGGLRIYQVRSVDENNHALLKTYKYGNDECGYGDAAYIPNFQAMMSTSEHWVLLLDRSGNSMTQPSTKKTETILYSDVLPTLGYYASLPVFYTYVTEYQGDEANNTGKITYRYSNGNTRPISSQPFGGLSYQLWKKSDLLQKDIYLKTNNASNPYSLVRQVTNTYTETTYPSETVYGLWIRRRYFILPNSGNQDEIIQCPSNLNNPYLCSSGGCTCYGDYFFAASEGMPIYDYGDYTFEVGKDELTATRDSLITASGGAATYESYKYNSNHLLQEKHVTDSKGNDVNTTYKYPPDFALPGNVYQTMTTMNMVAPVIEQTDKENTVLLQSVKTNYYSWPGINIIAPVTIDTKHGTDPNYETRLRYNGYDNRGNILSVSKENDVNNSYIWGYNQTYPIAKVVNASNTEIAYSGFEYGTEMGNWSTNFNPTFITNGAAVGKGYLAWYGGTISKTGLNTGKKYKVSFFAKSSGSTFLSVSGAGNVSFVGNNLWNRYEVEATGVSTITLAIVSGQVSIDELRLYPSDAQMTTYTYDPLIGMTSATDENNQTIFYIYDTFGRLQEIKDNNGNVLKHYEYHYNGQPIN